MRLALSCFLAAAAALASSGAAAQLSILDKWAREAQVQQIMEGVRQQNMDDQQWRQQQMQADRIEQERQRQEKADRAEKERQQRLEQEAKMEAREAAQRLEQYRSQFHYISSPDAARDFIAKYQGNDPDGLIPSAMQRGYEVGIKRNEECIAAAQRSIAQENEIGRTVGVVNKVALYQAGQMLIGCRGSLARYKAEKLAR